MMYRLPSHCEIHFNLLLVGEIAEKPTACHAVALYYLYDSMEKVDAFIEK